MFSSVRIVYAFVLLFNYFNKTLCQKEKVTSTCGKDVIELIIPTSLVREAATFTPVHHQLVMFKSDASEHCRAKVHDENHYVMTIKLTSNFLCGTKMNETKRERIYTNEIVWMDSSTSLVNSLYNLTCLYSDEESVYIIPKSSREIDYTTPSLSKVRATMNLFRDKSFFPSALFKDDTPSISVGQFVYVSVNLTHQNSLNPVTISSNNCYASYYPSSKDKRIVHNFIQDGCVHERDSSVMIFNNGNVSMSQWRFQMFKWVNVTVQKIYLFCEIDFCETTDCRSNNKTVNCFKSGRNRRETLDGDKQKTSVVIATGPIFPTDSEMMKKKRPGSDTDGGKKNINNLEESNQNVAAIAIGVVSSVCVLIVLVAGIIMYRRHKKKKIEKEEAKSPKNEIEQGFAFAITSSNDQNLYGNETKGSSEKPTKGKKVERSRSQKLRSKIMRSASALSRKSVNNDTAIDGQSNAHNQQ